MAKSNADQRLVDYFEDITDGDLSLSLGSLANTDAFGRIRVSNPETIFDSKNIYDDSDLAADVENLPLFYDNQETSGSGTSTLYNNNRASQFISVSENTAGKRVRQTKMRFNYQPAKSQLVFLTFNLNGNNSGNIKRIGLFDDNNGLFLELDGSNINVVQRSNVTGSPTDTKIPQTLWNIRSLNGDKEPLLDITTTQILVIDFEWLGVGSVRFGFVIDGRIYYVHRFLNGNALTSVYMSTPNLPIRSEIENSGTGIADSIEQICSSIISEGGKQELGIIRYASTEGTHLDANVENTVYALIGIRLKTTHIAETINPIDITTQIQTASHRLEWILLLNPTVAGTFTYNGVNNSAVEIAKGVTANTVTGGIAIAGGFVESGGNASGGAGNITANINNAIRLGSLIDGTRDTLVLCVRPIGGSSNVDVEGAITWRELT